MTLILHGSHKIVHAYCAKFMLIVSVSFFSFHKNRDYFIVCQLFTFFHSKDIDMFQIQHINFQK